MIDPVRWGRQHDDPMPNKFEMAIKVMALIVMVAIAIYIVDVYTGHNH